MHYDGSEPSGFTSSTYRGMDGWTAPVEEPVDDEICSLADIIDAAREGFFPWLIVKVCFMDAPRICLNPTKWINGCEDD